MAPAGGVLRLGPLVFQPGVTGTNVAAVLYSAFITIALMSFLGFVQPFVLTEILKVPAKEQGALTGNLVLLHEAIVLSIMGFSGAASDRFGRRAVFVTGFLVVAAGFALYPLVRTIPELYGARAVFAVGAAIAPIMVTATAVDLIDERSRGRWVGLISVMTALGAVFMALVLSRLPDVFVGRGQTPEAAGRDAFRVASALCLVTTVILWAGIRGGVLSGAREVVRKHAGVLAGVKAGARDAVANPRLALALWGGFIGRGDFAVIGVFFSLWIVHAGTAAGMATGEALAYAGRMFGLVQFSAMVWGACMGFLSDRMDRTAALGLAALLAAVGYGALALVGDPFSPAMMAVAVLAGIGEVSVVVAASSLLGQQAPEARRGALSGLYGVLGAVGIAAVSYAGGQLFDREASGPFLLMAVLNLLLLGAALLVRLTREPAPATSPLNP